MEYRTLGTVATYINGRAFKPSEWEQNGLPIIRIQNLNDEDASYNYCSQSLDEKFKVKKGDLLFAWSASLGAHIWNKDNAWLNQHIFKVIPDKDVNKMFLYYYLCKVTMELYSKAHGTGMVHITKKPFMNTIIPLPPLAEQERIVAKIEELFSELDNAVETLNTTKAKLEVYRQAVLLKAFEPKNNWNIGKLGDVIQVLTDYHANGSYEILKQHVELLDTPDYAVMIRSTNFEQNDFSNDLKYITKEAYDFLKKSQLFGDEVLMCKIGNAGKVYYMKDLNRPMSLAMNLFAMRFDHCVSSKYVYYFLNSAKSIEDIKKHIKGVGTPTINKNSVRGLYFTYPDTNEQKNIVTEVETKLSLYDSVNLTLDNILRQASAMRQSILKQAFEGRLL